MEVLKTSTTKEDLWINFISLRESLVDVKLPIDYISYECSCGKDLYLFNTGAEYFENSQENMQSTLDEAREKLKTDHQDKEQCLNPVLKFKSSAFLPETLVMFLDNVEPSFITSVQVEGKEFVPRMVIEQSKPIFALYQRSQSKDDTYYNLITDNFETYLQQKAEIEEDIKEDIEEPDESQSDCDKTLDEQQLDDSCPENFDQQALPRMVGGGRKILQ